jgi:hypothetical protein
MERSDDQQTTAARDTRGTGRVAARLRRVQDDLIRDRDERAALCRHDGTAPVCDVCARTAHPWP